MTWIVSANVGGIDNHQVIATQNKGCTYIQHRSPIDGWSDRMSGKFYKTKWLSQTDDIVIWVDGVVNITSPDFVEWCEKQIEGCDFCVPLHPERDTLAEEYEYILNNLHKPYLKTRYGYEDWNGEIEAFRSGLDAPLVNPRVFIADTRKKACKSLLSTWWELIKKYTIFDQSQLSYLLHERPIELDRDLKVKHLSWTELNNYVKIVKHKELK